MSFRIIDCVVVDRKLDVEIELYFGRAVTFASKANVTSHQFHLDATAVQAGPLLAQGDASAQLHCVEHEMAYL